MSAARHPLEDAVLRLIREERLIDPRDTVLIGVSGGMDSSALLFLLGKLRSVIPFSLAVAHVNHQLRGSESERDEAFVRELCAGLSVPCHSTSMDIAARASNLGISLQHAGRDVRYAYFNEISACYGYRKIAVAHNRDDQVETFLLRVVKGTGIKGLSSIPIKRGKIIRPFLYTYRSEIESYASQFHIPHVKDSSNAKDIYERNFLRNRIVPLMEQLNPQFREKVLLLLRDLTSINAVFDNETERFLEKEQHLEGDEIRFEAAALGRLHPETRFRVISRALARMEPAFIALREHVLLVEKSLFSHRPNNMVTLPHGIKVKRVYGDLVFSRGGAPMQTGETFEIKPGENTIVALGVTLDVSLSDKMPVHFPDNRLSAFFDAGKISRLTVRTFREGDRFVPLGMERSVKLKDYFMSRKIPRERRRNIPLLLSDDDIIWVVGERMDERYKLTHHTKRFLRLSARFGL